MFAVTRPGTSASRVLKTKRLASTSAQPSHLRRRRFLTALGGVATIGVSLPVGAFYLGQHEDDVIHADSTTDDRNSSRDVVVLDQANKPVQELAASATSAGYTLPDWSTLKEKVTDLVLPSWAKLIPGYYAKLQSELSAAPGSLAEEIWKEAHDSEINPEIVRDATVRVSSQLCDEEKAFLIKRKKHVRKALAAYLGVSETEVHPDDVPTIAMCGSGGGLRALVAGTSSYLSSQEAGLFGCTTYTAGVSGSCWLQSLYYSSITGQRHDNMIEHLKRRLDVHIAFPPPLLNMLTAAPTSKYLLSGAFEKFRGVEKADFGLVDIYGVMLGARLLVPNNELSIDDHDLKISNQRRFVDGGAHPLPIYTAVRHEIPEEEAKAEANADAKLAKEHKKEELQSNATAANDKPLASKPQPKSPTMAPSQTYRPDFQWLEWTPYEFFCEDFGAGIPTWSIGRRFSRGATMWRQDGMCLPELRLPLLMGIFGSAFCATLSHYYKEVRPIVQGLTGLGVLDATLTEKDESLVKIHPIHPAQVPNFVMGMKGQLADSCPESVYEAENIALMDAGMSNNLPLYPLLRPGRDVDIIVAFDASADVRQDNWLRVAEGYSKQRGIKGWPSGSGWPPTTTVVHIDNQGKQDEEEVEKPLTAPSSAASWEGLTPTEPNGPAEFKSPDSKNKLNAGPKRERKPESSPSDSDPREGTDLGFCTVWIGDKATPSKVFIASSADSPHPATSSTLSSRFKPHKQDSSDDSSFPAHSSPEHEKSRGDTTPADNLPMQGYNPLHSPTAGVAVIYFPLIPNPAVPAVDPQTSDYMSTWNFIYSSEQIDEVVALARANFKQGEELVREVVRGVWERKREARLKRLGKGNWEGGEKVACMG